MGESLAQNVVALTLGGAHRIATVAAPRYLHGRRRPLRIEHLNGHRCLNIRLPNGFCHWEYLDEGRLVTYQPKGH